ncbi:MAG: DUF4340 domain-containing protein [Lentisphaeria bacterium]|nr:DUF4340 domain-containing protein [Lentisphaeria bacterium]
MNNKPITFIVWGAVVAVAILLFSAGRTGTWMLDADPIGHLLVDDLKINEVNKISVKQAEKQVTLNLENNEWTIAEKDGFPASSQFILNILSSFSELYIMNEIPTNPYIEQQKNQVEVNFYYPGKNETFKFLLGDFYVKDTEENMKNRIASGRFVKFKGKTYLVARTFKGLPVEPSVWMMKILPPITPIKSIHYQVEDFEVWKLERKDPKVPLHLSGEIPNQSVILFERFDQLENALTFLSFVNVKRKVKLPNANFQDQFVVETQSGLNLKLELTEPDELEQAWVKVTLLNPDEQQKQLVELYDKWYFQVNISALTSVIVDREYFIAGGEDEEIEEIEEIEIQDNF